jgi:hypothetical protein
MLNKQSRTADKGWSSGLGVGRGQTTTKIKESSILQILIKRFELGLIFGTTKRTVVKGHNIRNLERHKIPQEGFLETSSKGTKVHEVKLDKNYEASVNDL